MNSSIGVMEDVSSKLARIIDYFLRDLLTFASKFLVRPIKNHMKQDEAKNVEWSLGYRQPEFSFYTSVRSHEDQ